MSANWIQIRTAYLHGSESLRAIASRFNVPAGTLLARAAAQNWSGQRNQLQSDAIETAEDSARETLLETLKREQQIDLTAVARMRLLWDDLLSEADRPADLKLLAQTLQLIQNAVRVSLHLPCVPLKVAPESGKSLRDFTNAELLESLLVDPQVRARLAVAGKDPLRMTDDEILEFCLDAFPQE